MYCLQQIEIHHGIVHQIQTILVFYLVPTRWKPMNNATWTELGAMINAPSDMYTHISLDGIHPLNDGSTLDSLRSAHLADILTEYRSILDKVDR